MGADERGGHSVSNPLERLTSAPSDRNTIEREIGAGGMATVYLAEDLDPRQTRCQALLAKYENKPKRR